MGSIAQTLSRGMATLLYIELYTDIGYIYRYGYTQFTQISTKLPTTESIRTDMQFINYTELELQYTREYS